MDFYELSTALTAQGYEEVLAALGTVDAAGTRAAASLTAVEASSAGIGPAAASSAAAAEGALLGLTAATEAQGAAALGAAGAENALALATAERVAALVQGLGYTATSAESLAELQAVEASYVAALAAGNLALEQRIALEGQLRVVQKAVRDAEAAAAGQVGKSALDASVNVGKIGAAWKGVVAAVAVVAVVKGIQAVVDEAEAAEAALVRVRVALRNVGDVQGQNIPVYQAAAAALQASTQFSDESALDALTAMTTASGSSAKALQNLGLAADFAAAKQIPLENAGEIVGKVLAGNTSILARYGIVLGENEDAVEALRAMFSGFAAEQGSTFAGAMAQTHNAFSDLLEVVGGTILENESLRLLLARMREGFAALSEWVARNTDTLSAFVDVGVGTLRFLYEVAAFLTGVLVKAWEGAQMAVVAFWGILTSAPSSFKAILAGIATGILEVARVAATTVDAVFGTDLTSKVDAALETVRGFGAAARAQVVANREAMYDTFAVIQGGEEAAADATAKAVDFTRRRKAATEEETKANDAATLSEEERFRVLVEGLDFAATRAESSRELERLENRYALTLATGNLTLEERIALEARLRDVQDARAAARPTVAPLSNEELAALDASLAPVLEALGIRARKQLADEMASLAETARASLLDALENGFTAAFSGANVGGGIAALGNTILSGLGSIMVSMGKSLLVYSGVMKALLPALKNPFTSGAAAAVAGLALIALGSALKAAATGGPSGGGGGGGSFSGAGGSNGAGGDTTTRIVVVPSAAGAATGNLPALPPVTFNVFGPNDPLAQRAVFESYEAFVRRGGSR